jgi:THO complex subunit 1 transcription elongation factor
MLMTIQIADTHFRRQFLFQLLILLNHLLTFTKTAKATWSSSRNRSLQMDFTLEATDAQWVQDTVNKAMEELRQTTPNGRAFAETVSAILEREKNWVKWKNELCAPFDKEPWSVEINGTRVGLLESTKDARAKMREPPKEWEHKLGSGPLTDIWEMGCRGLEDLRNPFQLRLSNVSFMYPTDHAVSGLARSKISSRGSNRRIKELRCGESCWRNELLPRKKQRHPHRRKTQLYYPSKCRSFLRQMRLRQLYLYPDLLQQMAARQSTPHSLPDQLPLRQNHRHLPHNPRRRRQHRLRLPQSLRYQFPNQLLANRHQQQTRKF